MPKTRKSRQGRRNRQARQRQPFGARLRNASRVDPENKMDEGELPMPSASQANLVVPLRELNLFGLRTRKLLRYEESVALTGSSGAVAAYVFSANGCYDPNISGTGHQPMGFDQMMVFFNQYIVLRSRIVAMVYNTIANMVKAAIMIASSDTQWSTNYQTNIEQGGIVVTTLSPQNSWNSSAVLRASCDIGRYQGMQNILDNPDLQGDSASNPAEQTYYIFQYWSPSVGGAPTVYVDFIIEYDVVFVEPKLPSQS